MPLLDTDRRLPRRAVVALAAALVALALVGALAAGRTAGERRARFGGDAAAVQAVRYVGG